MRRVLAVAVACGTLLVLAAGASARAPRVLRVGTYHGIRGQYHSIQAAVNAARPGDWILIAPGDWKTLSASAPKAAPKTPAAVLISTPRLRLRGMNRNGVIIDGTKSGPPCNAVKADQNFGPASSSGPLGLNGVMVWKADDVWVQNLTTCNFLSGAGDAGNGVWWNGGDGSAHIGGWGYLGSYLTATSTFFDPADAGTAAAYGIFSSNWSGGTWNVAYASNFDDSGFYIGACQQVCDQTVDHAWAEFNALGYSGSNSGGQLVVENSQFDHNEDGFDTNSQNGDNPPPQNGACPNNGISPITHTHSCWVFMHNYSHDNNNPNVPSTGFAAAGPVGTGISLSGARNDTVMDNTFANNGAWGTIVVPFPDQGPPCTGGTQTGAACIYDEWGDAVLNNTYTNNGYFGNPSNGDIGQVNTEPGPTDCFAGNRDTGGTLTTSPTGLETLYPACTGQTVPPDLNAVFADQVACDSEVIQIGPAQGGAACPPNANYPRRSSFSAVVMHPLPPASSLQSMPNPCAGVPANPWCPAKRHRAHRRHDRPDRRHHHHDRSHHHGRSRGRDPDHDGDVD